MKDVNDVSPVFVTANYTSIIENIPINTVVMAIKATDRDEGRNGYIEYNMSSAEKNVPFTLGPVDGLLRVSGRLDRELRSSYDLTVTAKDRGEPPKFAQTKISVKILDENDNSPVFDPKAVQCLDCGECQHWSHGVTGKQRNNHWGVDPT